MSRPVDSDDRPGDASLVHVLPLSPGAATALCALARSLGLRCARVDLEGCIGKDGLLERIGAVLEFPRWYGANWDALFDCLNDLEWLAAPGHVLVFENTRGLREGAPGDFDVLLDLLQESAVAWRERGVPFRAIVSSD
jgi:RNAse (barnase) inhibitor barstar